ncbi:hypothetical protein POM88_030313 [Heracleum sosnowskyi]|uniref:Transmembrane protein n=1 Tax=Heracleum sosnowskyi TaxID=360622 RepID=A0AAD8HVP9_9APIA|nr:hypothetical protein POM88_030313 [Heracleum sosnowskyi]
MEENIWEHVTEWDHVTQFDKDEFVIIDNTRLSEESIFPPNNHQDLPLTTPQAEEDSSDDIQEVPRRGDDQRWRECLKMMNSGIIRVAYKVRFYAVCVAKLWPVAAAGLLVIVLYRKVRPWRRRRRRKPEDSKDQWMLLSREKDQKINHLLLQIARMNEILSASQRIPVHRVV